MTILRIAASEAKSLYERQFPLSRWHDRNSPETVGLASNRLRQPVFQPDLTSDLCFNGMAFFTIGSCFAREVEKTLVELGQTVLSKPESGDVIAFHSGGYTNRYNSFSMLNELEFALGASDFQPESIVYVDPEKKLCLDLHSHPAGGFVGHAETLERRSALARHFARVRQADVVTITLGLAEAWYDLETEQYINVSPSKLDITDRYRGRFEFHVTDFLSNLNALEKIYELLILANPSVRIVVTVSPVPLLATFSGRDIVTANTYSKAVLRTCAEAWVSSHSERIVYFPSFEMASNSSPSTTWMPDRIHVSPSFVMKIMESFVKTFKCNGAGDAEQMIVKRDISELDTLLLNLFNEKRITEMHREIDAAEFELRNHHRIVFHKIAAFVSEGRVEEAWDLAQKSNIWTRPILSARKWRLMRLLIDLGVLSGDPQALETILDRTIVHLTEKPAFVRKLFKAVSSNKGHAGELCKRYLPLVSNSEELTRFFRILDKRDRMRKKKMSKLDKNPDS